MRTVGETGPPVDLRKSGDDKKTVPGATRWKQTVKTNLHNAERQQDDDSRRSVHDCLPIKIIFERLL